MGLLTVGTSIRVEAGVWGGLLGLVVACATSMSVGRRRAAGETVERGRHLALGKVVGWARKSSAGPLRRRMVLR